MNAPPESGVAWDAAQVEGYFARLTAIARGPAAPPIPKTPYHAAAAVLAAFNPSTLKRAGSPDPPQGAELELLLADSAALPDAEGAARWSLRAAARHEALRTFETREQLEEALRLNPRPVHDPLQRLLDEYILGTPRAPEELRESDLVLATQVVGWLSGVPRRQPLSLPAPDVLQRRLDLARLLNPMRGVVGRHFRGRLQELAGIQEHLGQAGGGALMVWGVGGTGKSTLLAKVALDLVEGRLAGRPAPVVYLDFDRKLLSPEKPASLLLEAVRQLSAQLPERHPAAEALAGLLAEDLDLEATAQRQSSDSRGVGALLSGSAGADRLTRLAELTSSQPEWAGLPLLVAVDTFEEVQYRSRQVVELVFSFLGRLQDKVPAVRIVVAGRVPTEGHCRQQIELKGLDAEAAVACLQDLGVAEQTARLVYGQIGGNPLALRLAAELVQREPEAALTDYLRGEEFAHRLRDELVQGYLFRRVLSHIHNPEVRKLAHPGLVLRKITPELVQAVLAGPCQIHVPDLVAAERLWNELARETALVVVESGRVLRHRPDLRREMIGLLRASRRGQVAAIHEAAVLYYEQCDDDASRAEELYHRLCLGQSAEELDRRWRPAVEPLLRPSLDELPRDGMAYVASRASMEGGLEAVALGAGYWQQADQGKWERKTALWVHDLIRQDRFEEALRVLSERSERDTASPLFALQARVLMALGRPTDARDLLKKALEGWPATAEADRRTELVLLLIRVHEQAGSLADAHAVMEHLVPPVGEVASRSLRLEIATAKARLARRPPDRAKACEEVAALLRSMSERDLGAIASVAREAAAELVESHPPEVVRVVGAVGVRMPDADRFPPLVRNLWRTLEQTSITSSQNIASLVQVLLGKAAERADPTLARWVATALRADPQATSRRAADVRSVHARARKGDEIAGIVETLSGAFDRDDVDALMQDLGVNLKELSGAAGTVGQMVRRLVEWSDQSGNLSRLITLAHQARPGNAAVAALHARHQRDRSLSSEAIRLRPRQVNQFVEALADAFPDVGPFRAMLRHRVGKLISRDALQEEDPATMARKVVARANEDGWAGPLLNAAREARPGHPRIYELACDYGLTAVKPEDDRRMRDAFPGLDIAAWRTRVGQLEGRVGGIQCPDGTSATGYLVGPDLFLTTSVLLSSIRKGSVAGRGVTVSFDRKRLDTGAVLNPGVCFNLARDFLVACEDTQDPDRPRYALLRLDDAAAVRAVGWPNVEPGAEARGWIRQYRAVAPAPSGWIVLYCAGGEPIGMAYASARASSSAGGSGRVRYPLPPLPGGAGAPVFDESLNLIGMHESRLGSSETNLGSEGIPIAAILEHLGSQGVHLEVQCGAGSLVREHLTRPPGREPGDSLKDGMKRLNHH